MSKQKQPKPEPEKLCYECGKAIIGHYEYVRTKRKTDIYICEKCKSEIFRRKSERSLVK